MTLQRYFMELENRGLIRCVSRSNKPGNEYEISVWDDFEQLKSGMDIMDSILQKLKNEEPSHNLHTTFTKKNVKVIAQQYQALQRFLTEPSQPSQKGQAATLSRPSVRDVPFYFSTE